METTGPNPAVKADSLLFLVLVPHRDCLPELEAYRNKQFNAGLDGAWAFPAVAPLALLKRPLSSNELKTAAVELRKLLGDKKIVSLKEPESGDFSGGDFSVKGKTVRFFGPGIELPLPALPPDAILQRWEKPILAPAIITLDDAPPTTLHKQSGLTWYTQPSREAAKVPLLTSRAIALANLSLLPADTESGFSFDTNYSFTWELGPLYWLPRFTGKNNG